MYSLVYYEHNVILYLEPNAYEFKLVEFVKEKDSKENIPIHRMPALEFASDPKQSTTVLLR